MNFVDGLYHKDVYLPECLLEGLPTNFKNIFYVPHARETAKKKCIILPNSLCFGEVFEVLVQNGKVVRACYRFSSSKTRDISIVFELKRSFPVAVTAWLNGKGEYHKINRSNYISSPN